MNRKFLFGAIVLVMIALIFSFEHKYDKLFRFFSLTLIPDGLFVSEAYEKKFYFYITDFLALSLLVHALWICSIPLKRFFLTPFWGVFVLAVLSIFASPFYNYPICYSKLLHLATPFILFSYFQTVFDDENAKRRMTQWIFRCLAFVGIVQSLIGVGQYLTQDQLGLRLIGETNKCTYITVPNGQRFLFDRENPIQPTLRRASGTLPHANIFGGLLTLTVFSCLYLLMTKDAYRALGYSIPFQVIALGLSFSRSALFSLLLGSILFLTLAILRKKREWLKVFGFLFASLALCFTLLFPQFAYRGGIVNQNEQSHLSDAVRVFHQTTSYDIIRSKPLLGLGFSQFSENAQDFLHGTNDTYIKSTAPHNVYLFLACEVGVMASLIFLITLIVLGFKSLLRMTTEEGVISLCALLAFGLISLCDFYLILSQQGKILLFLTVSLCAMHLPKRKTIQVLQHG